jgi:alpha-beta hydrolase superfamily lysophospholipase
MQDTSLALKATRLAFTSLGSVAPEPMALLAERMYFTARRHRLPERERAILEEGSPFVVDSEHGPLKAWRWEPLLPWERTDRGTVLLVHGWEGRASQLAASFAAPLLDRGFTVVGADAPGHGRSRGDAVDLPAYTDIVGALGRHVSANMGSEVRAVIAHSFGGAATTLALEGEQLPHVDAAVLVAPPCSLELYADTFVKTLGLTRATAAIFRGRLEQRFGKEWWHKFALDRRAQGIDAHALIVHDTDDRETPFTEGAALAKGWAGSTFIATSGLGHRRILREPSVVERAVAFIDEKVHRPS